AKTSVAAATPPPAPAAPGEASVLPAYTVSTFKSVFHRPEFWIANGAAGVAFLALLGYWSFLRISGGKAAQVAQARRQSRKLLDEMAARGTETRDFCEKGAAFLESRLGAASPEALAGAAFSPEEAARLVPMLTLRDEARYGVGRGNGQLSAETRAEILDILKKWEAKT
ncbi:MAG TPA: hypothetical protein VIS74_02870, partial [Chthoniobacterales bacterium]